MTQLDISYFNFQKERREFEVNNVVPRLQNLSLDSDRIPKKRKIV